jgi:hypothetical protein
MRMAPRILNLDAWAWHQLTATALAELDAAR